MNSYWFCDTCGEKIRSPKEGIVEWYSYVDDKGMSHVGKLRLVHEYSVSPLQKKKMARKGCAFDMHETLYKGTATGTVEQAPLGEFLGAEGLMRLLSFMLEKGLPARDVARMIKRLHVPGYDVARNFFLEAALEGIIQREPSEDGYSFEDIGTVVKWLEERKH
jgi:hypothetical protein